MRAFKPSLSGWFGVLGQNLPWLNYINKIRLGLRA